MRILVVTNIYTPFAGGVPRSIVAFREQFLARGHHVLVVAPRSSDQPDDEEGVVRVPAISNVYRDRYSFPWPIPGYLGTYVRAFRPDVIHSHHPFLLGSTAQRIAAMRDLPLVYTHHTQYDQYLARETARSRFAAELVSGLTAAYCEFCDAIIAPTPSVVTLLREAGVQRPIATIPTGVDFARFASGSRGAARARYGIPRDAPVVGHVGRLEREKNLRFLHRAIRLFLRRQQNSHYLLVGDGRERNVCEAAFAEPELRSRFHMPGTLEGQSLVDAYHAMDVFAFASHSETQGMVLTEAMAAGVPIVAVEAAGVRDIVVHGQNGMLLPDDRAFGFASQLEHYFRLPVERRGAMADAARRTARGCSISHCSEKTLRLYERVAAARAARDGRTRHRPRPMRFLRYEWRAWSRLLAELGQIQIPRPIPTARGRW